MLHDERQAVLAKNLVNYSCEVKPGEKVWIDVSGADTAFINLLQREVFKAGGEPHVHLSDNRVKREMLMSVTDEQLKFMAERDAKLMSEMQAYIGVRGGNNSLELADVPADRMQAYMSLYSHKVHHEIRVKATKWVVLRYPTEGMSQLSGMSTDAFENHYFNVCNLDYAKMDEAMTSLVELMNRTDKVRLVAKNTDISFSIKDIPSIKCSGLRNIPDGEVYTAPVRDSINGVISYNVPSIENGIKFENVRLEFKKGKIVKATANFTKEVNEIFDTDAGARYVGEFALGVNPYITKPMGDILFDEKISGSIHFTPGACYEDAWNGNESAVHWDLVLAQTPEYGGGEIWFDGVLIRKDGKFILPSLYCLNPENLIANK
ncbi:MAG: aminopeptidase [Clostridiaceae bacterium]|jgi:aminopeptidase|nr:aminopeptidase [Clostridiaceae bacterium]